MSSTNKVIPTDVVVIGSEAAGARAAIEADRCGAKVLIVTKSLMAQSGITLKAVFSCNAAFGFADPRDNPEVHFKDTVRGGRYINNQQLTEIFCRDAAARLDELAGWGVKWDEKGGKYEQDYVFGHTYPRALHVDWKTGLAMVKVLEREVKRRGIPVMEEFYVTNYLRSPDGGIGGCAGIDVKTGEFLAVQAKAVIDCTGGSIYLYSFNSGTREATGDGLAMAYRAGAELVDMEFFQFYPCALLTPPALRETEGLPTFGRYSIFGRLYNVLGERFMRRYDPIKMERSERDVVARAIYTEIMEGRGTPNGGVWLDCTFFADKIIETRIEQEAPGWVLRGVDMIKFGLDLRKAPLEVAPTAHYLCGGIKVNRKWASRVLGLYAAGEVVGGVHGANRLAGNALSECQVSGAVAGKSAAEYSKSREPPKIDMEQVKAERRRVFEFFDVRDGVRPIEVIEKIQKVMTKYVGVVRSESGLKTALEEMERIGREDIPRLTLLIRGKRYNRDWIEALEAANMLQVAEIMTKSALLRRETRGNHCRADHPNTSDEWLRNIVVKLEDGKMKLTSIPIDFVKMKPGGVT